MILWTEGMMQQTPAVRAGYQLASRGTRRVARKARKVRKVRRKVAARARSSSGNKFKKGSAAAKRHMAKLRAMRRK